MDWELVIDVISDAIKDESLREEIYKRLLEDSEDFNNAEDCLGSDDVFDRVFEEVYEEYENDKEDLYDDDGDDYSYDDE